MRYLLLAASVAFLGSASLALADDTAQPMAQPVAAQATTNAAIPCHHDGEVWQTPNGLVVCHVKPSNDRLHNLSREWFREQQLRATTMNGH